MAFYTRHQLLLLLVLVVVAGGGMAVGQWRRAHPVMIERLEQLDREPRGAEPIRAALLPPPLPTMPVGEPTSSGDLRVSSAHPRASSPEARARSPIERPPDRGDSRQPQGQPPGTSATASALAAAAARPQKLTATPGATRAPSIDINRATVDELTRLPGVGPVVAARIVETRQAEPFRAFDDLRRVRGLSPAKLDRLRPFVTVAP